VPDLHRLPFPLALLSAPAYFFTTLPAVLATRVNLWLPVLFWAGVIFAFSSVPGLSTDLGTWDTVLRTCAHLVEYAILGALLQRAFRREPLAVLAGSAYAVTDELHQSFVGGRQGSPLDWVIDTVGVVAGVLLFARLAR
jgi:VanZ family protein